MPFVPVTHMYNLPKKSFVISCLFKFLTWVCSCSVCVVFSFLNCFSFKCFSNFLVSLLTFSCNFWPLLWVLLTSVTCTNVLLHARLLLLFNKLYVCTYMYVMYPWRWSFTLTLTSWSRLDCLQLDGAREATHGTRWFPGHVLNPAVNNQDVIKMFNGHRNVVIGNTFSVV